MINFCVEPKKPCRKNPIGELDFKIDKCYSSIYSRLCHHIDDSVSHISQEERDEWNGKASKESLKDIQDQLNKITGDESGSMKYEILLEVSKQITAAIDGLNLGDYAKKKYVDDAIKNIELDDYVTKDHADSTYLKIVDYKKIDPTSYYTKAEVQKIIEDSTIGKDYPIQSFTIEDNKLLLSQKNGGQFRVNLSGIGSGVGVDTDYVQEQLSNYIKKNTLSKLVINDQTYSLESGRDIKIPTSGTGSSIDATKYGYSKSYFKKHSSNSVAPSKPSANRPPEDGSGWVEDAPNQSAGYYIWMTQVFINGNGQYGEYTNPICLTGTAGESAVSYDIKTSTSTINYQDGTMYPKTISVYVAKSNGSQITNITPSNSSGWSFSYSVDGGDAWTAISSDQIQTEGDNGMLFKATNGTIILSEYVPIVKSGINGSTYSLQLSNISLSYVPADQNYDLQMSCNVNLYKNENVVDSTDANLYNLYMQLNSNDRTTLQYNTDHWDATVNTTVQSKSSTITIYAYNTNGAYLTSVTIPVSFSGDTSAGQAFNGSLLRIVGEWKSGTKYYDGKIDVEGGIFYQDIVLYKNMYYVCINTDSGEGDHWNTPPTTATYWSVFSLSPNVVTDLIIANKAFIKELSSNELVIFDDQKIVAGMTSSKAVDESSPLNGKVTNKGDVRIWAGEMQTSGDLATAYTTIDSNGSIVMQNIQQGKSIKINPQECSFKIVGPVSVLYDSVDDGTYIPSSDERVELVNFEYTVNADSLSSAIRLIMKSNGMITIDPGAKKISVYSDKDSAGGSIIGHDSIDMYDDSGNLYTSFNGVDIAGRDFVTLTSRYNKKGLHLRRIDSAASNDILYILEGLPTSDPKIEGALWIDTDRTLKVSRMGFGS